MNRSILTRLYRRYLPLLAVLMLTVGCQSGVNLTRLNVDNSLLTPCPTLPLLDNSKEVTLGDLVMSDITLASLYNECKIRHSALSDSVRRFNQ